MPVTKDQAAALAQLAIACRPHGARHWDAAGVVAAIGKVKHLALADVALAAIRAADDRALETPAPIGNPSAHCWRERGTDRPAPREPFDRHATCGTCGKNEADCRRLWADDHEFESVARAAHRRSERGEDYDHRLDDALGYAREAVAEVKATGPEPPPEREHKHSPHVDELRAAVAGEVAE